LFRRIILLYRLSLVEKSTLCDYSKFIIIAPHPDDEILGLGGHIIRQIRSGKQISIVYLTNGEKSLEDIDSTIVASQRKLLSSKVHARLGVYPHSAIWLQLPDGAIPRQDSSGFNKVVMQLTTIINDNAPDAVFVTHPQETWPYDHVAAFELAESAINKADHRCDLYGYWVWLWYSLPMKYYHMIDWKNVCRIPIRDVTQEKRVLMDLYLKTLTPDGRPWSGVLPKAMLKAFEYPYEVITKITVD
jgi:LmbE family N-acetylglucosaminyl deacetylase